jgi:hypothetical protein
VGLLEANQTADVPLLFRVLDALRGLHLPSLLESQISEVSDELPIWQRYNILLQ